MRKITAEEGKDHKILIEKKALKLFPAINQKFLLIYGMTHMDTKVEAVDCQCGKKKKAHQHFFVKLSPGLDIRLNEKIKITKVTDENYQLTKEPI